MVTMVTKVLCSSQMFCVWVQETARSFIPIAVLALPHGMLQTDLQPYSTGFYLQVHLTWIHTVSTLKSLLLCEDGKSSVTLLLKTTNKRDLQGSQCLRRSALGVVGKSLKRCTFCLVLMWLRNGLSISDGTEGTDTEVAFRNCIQEEFNSAFNRATNYPHKSRIYKKFVHKDYNM